jgi:hypothetical protein
MISWLLYWLGDAAERVGWIWAYRKLMNASDKYGGAPWN